MARHSLLVSSTVFGGRWATVVGGFVLVEGDGCRTRNLPGKSVYIGHRGGYANVYRVQDEVSLLRASLQGDTRAWGEIISRYKDAVFGLCLGFMRNRADAEDISHDAFIRAYINLRRYDLERRFSTWLFTIAANLCRNQLRYRRNHPSTEQPPQIRGGTDPAKLVTAEDRQARIREALAKLSYSYRAPLVLRFYNELPYQEISDILSIPEGTVKTRIHRGKAKLKNLFEEGA